MYVVTVALVVHFQNKYSALPCDLAPALFAALEPLKAQIEPLIAKAHDGATPLIAKAHEHY
jgi:hypothetical protein